VEKDEGWGCGLPAVLVQNELVAGAIFLSSKILLVGPTDQIAVVPEVGSVSTEDRIESRRNKY